MKTLSYIMSETEKEIKLGEELYFGEVWNGEGDGIELLESSCISPDNENVVSFDIVEKTDNILNTLIKITDIY